MSDGNLSVDDSEVRAVAASVFANSNALQLASTGGLYSPWILGVYFATEDLNPVFLLETSGKTFKNLQVNRNVAFVVSHNDAMKDFVQGRGTVELLDPTEDARIRALLVEKMSWYQTYTPTTPVRLRVEELFVSSFSRQWFPARTIVLR